jgi:hypothetical protein
MEKYIVLLDSDPMLGMFLMVLSFVTGCTILSGNVIASAVLFLIGVITLLAADLIIHFNLDKNLTEVIVPIILATVTVFVVIKKTKLGAEA